MHLVSVHKATDGKHKYVATFQDRETGRTKTTAFGAQGMDDYTLTKNELQRSHYQKRHKKDLRTGDHTRAGFLSYYLLWGPSTSLQKNIEAYKSKFGA